ncbi:hypothetical protein [Paenibacillus sp. GYB003]|uniref:hypothetical protein n=1 Tax=Paenibacillus sp. GYB003 TaxID=2994392 RepID=UPI002F96A7B7
MERTTGAAQKPDALHAERFVRRLDVGRIEIKAWPLERRRAFTLEQVHDMLALQMKLREGSRNRADRS